MASTESTETGAVKYQQLATTYLAEGKLEEAKISGLKALDIEPNFAAANNTLGKILQAMGESESAREYFHKAIAQEGKFAEAYINLGNLYATQKQWDLAIASYQKAIDIEPKAAKVYRALAQAWTQLDKPESAATCWHQALTLEPELAKPWQHLELGNTLLKQGKQEEAIACYQQTIELNPKISQAYHNLGEIYSDRQEWEKAVKNYHQAVELNPEGVWSQYGLGKALTNLGHWEEATIYYRQAIQLKPDAAVVYHSLADALVKQNLLDEAINNYQRAREIQPEIWVVHHKLGNALQEAGELEEAIASYYRTLELKPDFLWSYYSLAEALFQTQKWDEAVIAYLIALKLNKDLPELHASLGYALQKQSQSDLEATINYYRQLVKANSEKGGIETNQLPSDYEFYLHLGNALAQKNQFNGAIVIYNLGLELKPNNPEICQQLNKLLDKKYHLEQEVANYRAAIKRNSKVFLSHYKLGEVLQELQEWDEAASAYLRAIRQKPEYPWFFYYSNLLKFIVKENKLEQLHKIYRRATKANYDIVWGHVNLGEILTIKGKIEQAITSYQTACYNKIRESHPGFVEQNWNLKNARGPDFIIIGAQKSGTTSLENYISQHPQVLPAVKKETHFWYRDFNKGIDWYLAHFPPIPKSSNYLTGEATPNYLENWQVALRIKKEFPDVKLLLILRDPIDRAFSQYNHWIRLRWEDRSFEEAINSEIELLQKTPEKAVGDKIYWKQPGNYIGRGIYIEFIKKWLEVFPREQLLILRGEELYREPTKTMQEVFDFLGLPAYELSEYRKLNAGSYAPISESMRQKLIDYFEPYNQKLEEYLGLEFQWEY